MMRLRPSLRNRIWLSRTKRAAVTPDVRQCRTSDALAIVQVMSPPVRDVALLADAVPARRPISRSPLPQARLGRSGGVVPRAARPQSLTLTYIRLAPAGTGEAKSRRAMFHFLPKTPPTSGNSTAYPARDRRDRRSFLNGRMDRWTHA